MAAWSETTPNGRNLEESFIPDVLRWCMFHSGQHPRNTPHSQMRQNQGRSSSAPPPCDATPFSFLLPELWSKLFLVIESIVINHAHYTVVQPTHLSHHSF